MLNLDERAKRELEEVRRLAEKLGRPPKRKEAPEGAAQGPAKWCGSWSNTLFQLAFSLKKKRRSRDEGARNRQTEGRPL